MRARDKREMRKIARERIEILLSRAEKERDSVLAKRYVDLALRIAKKYRVRIPKRWKRRFCKKCHAFWHPGENLLVRLVKKPHPHVLYICLECGRKYRFPYH